jgi:tetratricopeptide (TPR) repeat protein
MRVLRLSPDIRVAVSISRGEDFANIGEYNRAIDEFQVAIDEDRLSSLAYFRMGEALFELGNLQAAANVFREGLNGDLDPRWVEVWAYVNLGKIYDIRGQRERAVTEYQKAVNTSDDAYGAQGEAKQYIANPFRRSGSPTVD